MSTMTSAVLSGARVKETPGAPELVWMVTFEGEGEWGERS